MTSHQAQHVTTVHQRTPEQAGAASASLLTRLVARLTADRLDRDIAVGRVGGVPGAPHADFDHGDVDGRIGEHDEGEHRQQLEERQRSVAGGAQLRVDQVDERCQLLLGVGDGAVVDGTIEESVVWPGGRVHASEHLRRAIRTDAGTTVLVRRDGSMRLP